MAKKTIFLATDPTGAVHQRTSETRTYTHAVIARPSYAAALVRANDKGWRKQDAANWVYRTACAAGTHEIAKSEWTTDSQRAEWAKFAADFPACDAYVEHQHADRVARVEASKAAGHFDKWQALTWCGRPDLAQKEAASRRGNAGWARVEIVAVTIKGSR